MTLNALLDTLKEAFDRAGTGPLKSVAWQLIRTNARRDLQRLLARDSNLADRPYQFHSLVDSDGTLLYNLRSRQAVQTSWLQTLTGPAAPEESLETSGTIRRRNGGRATVELVSFRRTPTLLAIGRSTPPRVREEGSPAVVRGGTIDPEALASLSGALRSTSGARRASAPVPESPDEP